LCGDRTDYGGRGRLEWHHHAAKLARAALLILICLVGGRSIRSPNPAAIYSRTYEDFLLGHLDRVQQEASSEELALRRRTPYWSFKFRLLQAEALQFQGRSQDVVRVLGDHGQSFPVDGDLAIKQAILLSLADARLGLQQPSSEQLERARRLSEATHSALQGEVLRVQGLLESRNGLALAADRSLRESLEFARASKDGYLEASDLLNLGTVALRAERIDEALYRFKASSEIAERIHAELLLQSDEGNTGWAYYLLGDFDQALESFRQAEAQARRLGATDSEILWLQREGMALSWVGDLKQAQSSYEEALKAAQASRDVARQADADTSLGRLFLELGRLDLAKVHADAGHDAAHQIGDLGNELDASLIQALISARISSPDSMDMLLRVVHDAAQTPAVRWEAEDALGTLCAARHLPAQADLWYRKSIQTFEAQRDSVQDEERRLPFFANGDELYRHYAEFLIASQRSNEALHLLDSYRARTLKEGLGERRTVVDSHVAGLPAEVRGGKAVVLFYSLGPQASYLWTVDRTGPHLFDLPPGPEIAARVKSYQTSILKSRDPLADHNSDAIWLYKKLVGPAETLIPKEARVFVIPDGSLNGFNFETLLRPEPQGAHYWVEDVSLTTAASLQLLSHLPPLKPERDKGRLLVIGDPVHAGGDYSLLPHAAAEIESVEHYFPDSRRTTLTQAAAVPEAYPASHPGQYAYLHFVAHGTASSLRPLDSAIVLSPSAADADHFKLYARDIVHQRLTARLVTISSCYGSGVRHYVGEGMVGLSWAFLRAGAHQVIGALWQVDDSSTPELMNEMYRGLNEGAPPDQALRRAKLSLLHSQGVVRKPLYWGAFQLYSGL